MSEGSFIRSNQQRRADILAVLTDEYQTCKQIGERCALKRVQVSDVPIAMVGREVEIATGMCPKNGGYRVQPLYRLKRHAEILQPQPS